MAKAKYISLTCDLWSRDTRSFIAANGHWINADGKLETALLACERFKGHHTADNIASKVKAIIHRFDISSKVVAITTDNASNFKCCFERHGDNYESMKQLMENSLDEDEDTLFQCDLDDLVNMWCPSDKLLNSSINVVPLERTINHDLSDDDDSVVDSIVQSDVFRIENMPEGIIQNVIDDVDSAAFLPSRVDCSAHSFNLIGKVDAFDALDGNNDYSHQYISVFTKLNEIWRVNSTRLGRETFRRYLPDKIILKPHRIRWNRVYDAVSTIFFLLQPKWFL